jgi:hypothetical protein
MALAMQNRDHVTSSAGIANIVRRKSTINPSSTAVVYAAIEINAAFQKFRCISGADLNVHSLSDASIRFNRASPIRHHGAIFALPATQRPEQAEAERECFDFSVG